MKDYSKKTHGNLIIALALVGVTLLVGLLLEAQKGETRDRRRSERRSEVGTIPARLTVESTTERKSTGETYALKRKHTSTVRETINATFLMEVPDIDYWRPYEIHGLIYAMGKISTPEYRKIGGGQRERLPEGRLVNYSGQVNYFSESYVKQVLLGKGPEESCESTTTTEGSTAFKLEPHGLFRIQYQGVEPDGTWIAEVNILHSGTLTLNSRESGTCGPRDQPPPPPLEYGPIGASFPRSGPLHVGPTPKQQEQMRRIPGLPLSPEQLGGLFGGLPEGWTAQVRRTPTGLIGTASFRKIEKKEDIIGEDETQVTQTVSFTFSLGEAEVVVTPPKNLPDWIPKGGENENTSGDQLKFEGKVQGKGSGRGKVKVVFELTSSREPGIAMNFPPKAQVSEPPRPDLQILKDGTSSAFEITEKTREDGLAQYRAEGEFKVGESFTLVVGSFDYGAYGYLNVSADASVRIEGYPEGTKMLWIPRDDNKNTIADKWEEEVEASSSAANSDEDNKPPGDRRCFEGDGLSLYEEYRGFMVKGKHTQTNPNRKDLFIHSKVPHDSAGIDLFYITSGIKVHRVDEGELDSDRVINFNSSKKTHVVDQHGLVMIEADLDEGIAGGSPIGPPVYVDKVLIKKDYLNNESPNRGDNFMGTIAHELGHAVGIVHHGEGDYKRMFRRGELPCLISDGKFTVAVQNGQHSGVENCIMRYRTATVVERGGKFECYSGGAQRELFCNAKGPNPLVGEATNGNCMSQICLSDRGAK
jgi:hypothetical protein